MCVPLSGPLAKDLTESRGKLWTVATVLPEQFYTASSNLYHGRPEAALMHAVLEDAVNCVLYGSRATNRREQRLAREAEEWLLSDDADCLYGAWSRAAVHSQRPATLASTTSSLDAEKQATGGEISLPGQNCSLMRKP